MKTLEELKTAVELCRHVADKNICPQCPYREFEGMCHIKLREDILGYLRLLEF